jgi:hypothetical protein
MGMANDRWLSRRGEAIDTLRQSDGACALTPQDRLIELVWLMARSMRSTGDLAAARATDPAFLNDALAMATCLGLPAAVAAFSASEGGLERRFFDLFDVLCAELQRL